MPKIPFNLLVCSCALLCFAKVQGQDVEVASQPAADGEVINVCAGSTVLFSNATSPSLIFGETTFIWTVNGDTLPNGSSGPVPVEFELPGTYEVILEILTFDGEGELGAGSLVVEVGDAPVVIPGLAPANPCTFEAMDPATGIAIFQTQNSASCTCTNPNMGPAVQLLDTDQYPANTVSRIFWGGTGSPANGGTSPFTEQLGPFPTASANLESFEGQQSILGHYLAQGTYWLVHEVEFPGGCVFSRPYVVSWGAAIIDLCANSAQSVCFPSDYELCFDQQHPGTVYEVDWGDGSFETYAYPDLPTFPNLLNHSFSPSCTFQNGEWVGEPFEVTITAVNACDVLLTENVQGPFFVSDAPVPAIASTTYDLSCQGEEVTLINATDSTGTEASAMGCSTDYSYGWSILGPDGSPVSDADYEVLSGELGDFVNPEGSDSLTIAFDSLGAYTVVLSAWNDYCENQTISLDINVGPTPIVPSSDTLTLCTGDALFYVPSGSGVYLPSGGTTFMWTVDDSPNIEGEQSGSSTEAFIQDGPLTNFTNDVQSVLYHITPIGPEPGVCPGEPFDLLVDVVPGIVVPDTVVLTACSGMPVEFAPIIDAPQYILPDSVRFSWAPASNPDVVGATPGFNESVFSQTLTTSTINPAQEVHYDVTASLSGACNEEHFHLVVVINEVEAGGIGPDQLLCYLDAPGTLEFNPGEQPEGSGSLSYAWQVADNLAGPWTTISQSDAPNYTQTAPFVEDTYYRVRVTSSLNGTLCSAYSDYAMLDLNVIDDLEVEGTDTLCVASNPAAIGLVGLPESNWTFQWQNSPNGLEGWSNINGATTHSLDLNVLTTDLWYRLVVTAPTNGLVCPTYSDPIGLSVNAVIPGTLSTPQVGCEGEDTDTLQVLGAQGDGELTFEWQFSPNPGGPWAVVQDSAVNTFTADSFFVDAYYRVEVTSTWGSSECTAATAIVPLQVNFVDAGEPEQDTLWVCAGAALSPLSHNPLPSHADPGELTFQWQQWGGAGWADLAGEDDFIFNPPPLLEDAQFRMVAKSTWGESVCVDTSGVWTLMINEVNAGSIDSSQILCAGATPEPLHAAGDATGDFSLSQQWQVFDPTSGAWLDIAGAVGDSLPLVAALTDAQYRLSVISEHPGGSCPSYTESVLVDVVPQPELALTSAPTASACVADSATGAGLLSPWSVEYFGGFGSPTYSWFDASGNALDSGPDSTFMPPSSITPGVFEYMVVLELDGTGCHSDTLGPAADMFSLTVYEDPQATLLGEDAVYCLGAATPANLVVEVQGGVPNDGYAFIWIANGDSSASVSPVFTPSVASVDSIYTYVSVVPNGLHCEAVSDSVLIEVVPVPALMSTFEDLVVCAGAETLDTLDLAYAGGVGNADYVWFGRELPGGEWQPLSDEAQFVPASGSPIWMELTGEVTMGGGCPALHTDTIELAVNDVNSGFLQAVPPICSGEEPAPIQVLGLDWSQIGAWTANIELSYEWMQSSEGADEFTLIQDATSNPFQPGPLADTTWFAAVVSSVWNGLACSDTTAITEVVVHPLPEIQLVADTVCNSGVANVGVVAAASEGELDWTWEVVSANGISGAAAGMESALPLVDGPLVNDGLSPLEVMYAVSATRASTGCVRSDSVGVLVMPDVVLTPVSDTVCSGSDVEIDLNAMLNVDGTFIWYTINNPNIVDATNNSPSQPSEGATIVDFLTNASNSDATQAYWVQPTSIAGGCSGEAANVVVEVRPPLEASFLGEDPVGACSGEALEVTLGSNTLGGVLSWKAVNAPLVGGETVAWQVGSDVISETLTNVQNSLQPVEYWAQVQSPDGGCVSPIDTLVVWVSPVPQVTAVNDAAFCNGDGVAGISFSANLPGVEFSWSHSNGAVGLAPVGGDGNVPGWTATNSGNLPVSSVFEVSGELEVYGVACSSEPTGFQVTVLPTPQVDPLADLVLCEGVLQPAIGMTSTNPGTTFQWSVSSGSVGLTSGVDAAQIPSFLALNPTTGPLTSVVTVMPVFPNPNQQAGCPGVPIEFSLTVLPAPEVSIGGAVLCSGEAVSLPISTDLPSTWVWSAIPNPSVTGETTLLSPDSTIADVLTNGAAAPVNVNYVITATALASGCVGSATTATVTVNPLPMASFSFADEVLCDSVAVEVAVNAAAETLLEWDFGGGESLSESPLFIQFDSSGVYAVSLIATDPATGCIRLASESVEVFTSPDAEFTWSATESCGPSEVFFSALNADSSMSFVWDFGDGTSSTQAFLTSNQYAVGDCYDLSLTLTSAEGCAAEVAVEDGFCAHPQPQASFYPSPGTTTLLEPDVTFVNQSTSATQYAWDFGDGTISYDEFPIHTYAQSGEYMVSLEASYEDACFDEALARVRVKHLLQVYVPNAFTADQDGLADSWCPLVSDASLLRSYHLWVYNRWGDVVFESEVPGERWVGGFAGGDHFVPNGVYNWVLALDVFPDVAFDCPGAGQTEGASTDCMMRGHVTLLR